MEENQNEVVELSVIEQALTKENITAKVITAMREKYGQIKIGGIDDVETIALAEEGKKELSKLRNLAVKICKAGRENAIKEQKDWIAKEKEVTGELMAIEEPLKAALQSIEEEKERVLHEHAQRGKLPIRQARLQTIGMTVPDEELLKITDVEFIALFNDLQSKQLQEREAKIREHEERIAAEKAEADRKEAERLAEEKRQRELAEAAEKAKQEAEARAKEEAERKEKEAAEALQREKEAREKAERDAKIAGRVARLSAIGVHKKEDGWFADVNGDVGINQNGVEHHTDEDFEKVLLEFQNTIYEMTIARKEHAERKAEEDRLAAERKAQEDREAAERKAREDAEAEEERKRQAELAMDDKDKFARCITQLHEALDDREFKSAKYRVLFSNLKEDIEKAINQNLKDE